MIISSQYEVNCRIRHLRSLGNELREPVKQILRICRNVSEIDKRFSKVDSKLDRSMNMLPLLDTASLARERPQSTCSDTAVAHTVTGTTGADTVGYELHDDDTLSIQPGQQERTQLLGDDESLHSNSPSHANSLIGDHCVNNNKTVTLMIGL